MAEGKKFKYEIFFDGITLLLAIQGNDLKMDPKTDKGTFCTSHGEFNGNKFIVTMDDKELGISFKSNNPWTKHQLKFSKDKLIDSIEIGVDDFKCFAEKLLSLLNLPS